MRQCRKGNRDLSNGESVNLHSVKLFGKGLNVTESYLFNRDDPPLVSVIPRFDETKAKQSEYSQTFKQSKIKSVRFDQTKTPRVVVSE